MITKNQTSPKGENHSHQIEESSKGHSGTDGDNPDTSFEDDAVNYFKGKNIKFADKLLFETAKNNFSVGFQSGAEKTKQEDEKGCQEMLKGMEEHYKEHIEYKLKEQKQEILREIEKSQSIMKHNFNFKNTMAGKYREQGMNIFIAELKQSIMERGKGE